MPKIEHTNKYVPFFHKPRCCAAAILQMIIYRQCRQVVDQESLAIDLGVRIHAHDRKAFGSEMPRMTKFNHDEGINTLDSVRRINQTLRKRKIRLKASSRRYGRIRSFEQTVARALSDGKDVWAEFRSHEIHDKPRVHDGLIEAIDTKRGVVTLLDPSPKRRQRIDVPINVMKRALSSKYGKELGLVIIQPA